MNAFNRPVNDLGVGEALVQSGVLKEKLANYLRGDDVVEAAVKACRERIEALDAYVRQALTLSLKGMTIEDVPPEL